MLIATESILPAEAGSYANDRILSIENLYKSFAGRGRVLDNVSLHLHAGASLGLIGSNGCGKSTLLRCSLNLLKQDSGSITLFGNKLAGLSKHNLQQLRGRVGIVWQQHNLTPSLSVLSNVIHGALSRCRDPRLWRQYLAPAHIREEAMDCLQQVGLAHLASRKVANLSGGESQRVAIARVLMQQPQLVLADEPAASLDPHTGEEVMSLLKEVCISRAAGLLFVSHDIEQAKRYAHRLVGLRQGQVMFDKPTVAVSTQEINMLYV